MNRLISIFLAASLIVACSDGTTKTDTEANKKDAVSEATANENQKSDIKPDASMRFIKSCTTKFTPEGEITPEGKLRIKTVCSCLYDGFTAEFSIEVVSEIGEAFESAASTSNSNPLVEKFGEETSAKIDEIAETCF